MDVALRIALLLVLLVILVVGVVVGLAHIISALIADAPYVPTRSSVLRAIINELSLTDQSVVYDLGCGDARLRC